MAILILAMKAKALYRFHRIVIEGFLLECRNEPEPNSFGLPSRGGTRWSAAWRPWKRAACRTAPTACPSWANWPASCCWPAKGARVRRTSRRAARSAGIRRRCPHSRGLRRKKHSVTGFSLASSEDFSVSLNFYCFSWGFTGFYWVLLGFTGFHRVSMGFTGFTGFHWVSLGFTGFY